MTGPLLPRLRFDMTNDSLGAVFAVICARGGSKGLPFKNKKLICGIPLTAHTVRQARSSGLFTAIAISSDDPEIRQIGLDYGADLAVTRPEELADDQAGKIRAIRHCLLAMEQHFGPANIVVDLDVTAPLRTRKDISAAIQIAIDHGSGNVLSCSPSRKSPYFNMVSESAAGTIQLCLPESTRFVTRQSAPATYDLNGSIYVWHRDFLFANDDIVTNDSRLYKMPSERGLDIDSQIDFDHVELLMQKKTGIQADESPYSRQRLQRIRAIAFDFDGVFTDNTVGITEIGQEFVHCDRSDGLGLQLMVASGVHVMIISKERNPVVTARANKLGLPCIQSCDDKLSAFLNWLDQLQISVESSAFMGNDVNDLPCMMVAGVSFAPADAHPSVLAIADVVTKKTGGHGAIREVSDLLLN